MKSVILFSVLIGIWTMDGKAQALLDTVLTIEQSTEIQRISLDIGSGMDALSISINGEISSGAMFVKVLNPDGEKQNGLQLKTQGTEDSDLAVTVKSKVKGQKATQSTVTIDKSGDSKQSQVTTKSGGGQSEGNTSEVVISSGEGKGGSRSMTITTTSNSNSNSNSNSDNNDNQQVYTYVSTASGDGAKGVLTETIDNPKSGSWIIEIKTENVTGEVQINVREN